jgi:hypothetical protein
MIPKMASFNVRDAFSATKQIAPMKRRGECGAETHHLQGHVGAQRMEPHNTVV